MEVVKKREDMLLLKVCCVIYLNELKKQNAELIKTYSE